MRFHPRKQIGVKSTKIIAVLGKALHLGAVTKIEKKEQTAKAAEIKQDPTKNLNGTVIMPIKQLSVEDKQQPYRYDQSSERSRSSSSLDCGVTIDEIDEIIKIEGCAIRGVVKRRDLVTKTDILKGVNRLGKTIGKVSIPVHV